MTKADSKNTPTPSRSSRELEAMDTLHMRLLQADGVLEALLIQYTMQNVDKMDHPLTAVPMLNALSALHHLLAEAQDAAEAMQGRQT